MINKNQEAELKHALLQLNLSEKEILIYLDILQNIEASILSISRNTGLSRGTVFDIAEKLKLKGFITEIKKGKKRRLIIESPTNQFYTILDKKHRELQKSKKLVEDILPVIKALNANDDFKPQMKVYSGVSGFQKVWDDILRCREKSFLSIARMETFIEFAGEKFLDDLQERKKKAGISSRAINEYSEPAKIMQQKDAKYNRKTLLAPKEFKFPTTEIIYDDKIAMFSTAKENIILVIESKDISETHRVYFEMLWRMLGVSRK